MSEARSTRAPRAETAALVGRDDEVRTLLAALAAAAAGNGRMVLVSGEAGIGKTRLADAFAEAARSEGATVLWGRCWEAGGAPAFWPWVQALRAHLRRPDPAIGRMAASDAAQVARILPELRTFIPDIPELPRDDSESARFQLFDALAHLLRAIAADHLLVLILDDVHVADEPSLLLLRFVATELPGMRLLVLGLFRDNEFGPDDAAPRLLAEIGRQGTTTRISLHGLTRSDVSDYLGQVGGPNTSPRLADALHRQTDGNPLFVGELVRLLAAEGTLDAVSRITAAPVVVPEGVRTVIGRRLARLSDACRALLARASVIGMDVELDVLAQMEGRPVAALLPLLDEAAAAQLVREPAHPTGHWRFRHALIRDVLYTGLPASTRTALHATVGAALEELRGGGVTPPLAELAHHFVLAAAGGYTAEAIRYSRLAAGRASEIYAHEEAARHYRVAVALATSDAERCELLIGLGGAVVASGDQESGHAAFLDAAEIATRLGLGDALARAAMGYGGKLGWLRAGADTRLIPLLERALEALPPSDSQLRVRLLARLAGALRDEPTLDRRATLSLQGLEMARRIGEPSTLGFALMSRFAAIGGPDALPEMERLQRELQVLALDTSDRERIGDSYELAAGLPSLRDPASRRADMEAYGRLAREVRHPSFLSGYTRMLLVEALFVGRLDDAPELLDALTGLGEQVEGFDASITGRLALFMLRREQGRLDEEADLVLEAATAIPGYRMFHSLAAYALAVIGRRREAVDALGRVTADGHRFLPRDLNWHFGMCFALEAAVVLGDRERAAAITRLLEPHAGLFAIPSIEVNAGPIDRYLGLGAALDGELDAALAHLERAEQLAARAGSLLWATHARIERAEVLVRRNGPGDLQNARDLAEEGAADARQMGAVVLEAQARAIVPASDLPASVEHLAGSGGVASAATQFRREGDVWAIGGTRVFRLRDMKGLGYLAALLAQPGREVHALDLAGGPGGAAGPPLERGDVVIVAADSADGGEPLDGEAKAAYRARILELRALIDRAAPGDIDGRVERAHEEVEAITAHLAAAYGLGGRARPTGSAGERARQSVTKAIDAAISRIAAEDPALGAHLVRSVRTGRYCVYDPDPGAVVAWVL